MSKKTHPEGAGEAAPGPGKYLSELRPDMFKDLHEDCAWLHDAECDTWRLYAPGRVLIEDLPAIINCGWPTLKYRIHGLDRYFDSALQASQFLSVRLCMPYYPIEAPVDSRRGQVKVPIEDLFYQIRQERARQDTKFGQQDHSPMEWLPILMEEVGEAAKAALEVHFGHGRSTLHHYRKELVQVAAVAVAMIECLDRQEETS